MGDCVVLSSGRLRSENVMINSPYTIAHMVWLEGAGTTSLDQIGGYTADLVGSPAWSTDAPFSDAGSILLDGSTQCIAVPGILAGGQREFTVALRYKPSRLLPEALDRPVWSITGRDAPQEDTLDVLWRQTSDQGGYLWVRGMQAGVPIAPDVKITNLQLLPDLWSSLVITTGLAGLYVYHNGIKVGGRKDFPWPAFAGGNQHDFTMGGFSIRPSTFLPAAVSEMLLEGRMWTDREALAWHRENVRYLTEHGKWVKMPWNPALAPTQAWETILPDDFSLQEPNLLYENGTYKLWYTGGYNKESIGYATSPDGLVWSKCPINPVLGNGNGGEPATAARGYVVKVVDTYYLFYNSTGDEKLATSSDGIHWTSHGVIIRTTDWPWRGEFGNVCVWVEGAIWYMIFEAFYTGSQTWEMGAATSADGRNWNLLSPNPLRSMQIGTGCYGGAMVIKSAGVYHCWYQAAAQSRTGDSTFLPTAIYRATSHDLVNWQVYSQIPVLSLTQEYEVDQVADPTIAEINGRCVMLWDGMDNFSKKSPQKGALGLATFNGPLTALLKDKVVRGRRRLPVSALEQLLLQ